MRLSGAVNLANGGREGASASVRVREESAAATAIYRAGPDGLVGVADAVTIGLLEERTGRLSHQ